MGHVVIVSELRSLPPAERWEKLVVPLAEQLDASGLGRILDFDSIRHEANDIGRIEAEELAVELANLGYGRELLKSVISAAGVTPAKRTVPKRWLDYHCEDYFAEGWTDRHQRPSSSATERRGKPGNSGRGFCTNKGPEQQKS